METILAALVTAGFGLAGVWLTVRRPMKKEHRSTIAANESNAKALGRIEGTLGGLVDQATDTEHKIDGHIADHARGEFN